MYDWKCPKCEVIITYSSLAAKHMAIRAGGCQGCRAKVAFARNPSLLGLFTEFWSRTNGFPVSSSWTASVPVSA